MVPIHRVQLYSPALAANWTHVKRCSLHAQTRRTSPAWHPWRGTLQKASPCPEVPFCTCPSPQSQCQAHPKVRLPYDRLLAMCRCSSVVHRSLPYLGLLPSMPSIASARSCKPAQPATPDTNFLLHPATARNPYILHDGPAPPCPPTPPCCLPTVAAHGAFQ